MGSPFDAEKRVRPGADLVTRVAHLVRVARVRRTAWQSGWAVAAEERRLTLIDGRAESVDVVGRMSRVVLIPPLAAVVVGISLLLVVDNATVVLVALAALLGFVSARRRRTMPKRRPGETPPTYGARVMRRRRATMYGSVGGLVLLALVLVAWSSVGARLVAIAALLAYAAYRYAYWRLDLYVLSTSALWRFQGLIAYRVSSLEYIRIQAGPNATSGLATWLPIGTLQLDSAAQTGDLSMQRIGPVWGAEELAADIFERRKRSGKNPGIIGMEGSEPEPASTPAPPPTAAPEPPYHHPVNRPPGDLSS